MLDGAVMNDVIIRRPTTDDVSCIYEFFRLVLVDTYQKNGINEWDELLADEMQGKRNNLQLDFDSYGRDRFFLIGEYKGQIICSIEYGIASNLINECTHNELKEYLEIGTVYVHPSYQGKGISTLLYYSILQEIMNKGVDEVCLDSGYETAQKIWNHRFGKPAYHIKDFWGPEGDHMIWKFNIGNELERCSKVLGEIII